MGSQFIRLLSKNLIVKRCSNVCRQDVGWTRMQEVLLVDRIIVSRLIGELLEM